MSAYSPQQILDQLHEIEIPDLYAPELSTKGRHARIKLAKQKLKAVKQRFRAEETYINRKWDGRNQVQATIKQHQLLPWNLLDELFSRL